MPNVVLGLQVSGGLKGGSEMLKNSTYCWHWTAAHTGWAREHGLAHKYEQRRDAADGEDLRHWPQLAAAIKLTN
jgi:hypothetical protein